jgi:nucleotide-binding universal stress UspA family protein
MRAPFRTLLPIGGRALRDLECVFEASVDHVFRSRCSVDFGIAFAPTNKLSPTSFPSANLGNVCRFFGLFLQSEEQTMLAIRTILHPTDFSERSDFAFRLACSLARDYGARLIVLHVAEPPAPICSDGLVVPAPQVYNMEALRVQLHKIVPRNAKIPIEHRLIEGDAALQILNSAEETKCDVIVMGTHGRTALSRLLMGSVAENLVRKAPCPVVTVKSPLPEACHPRKNTSEAAGSPASVMT